MPTTHDGGYGVWQELRTIRELAGWNPAELSRQANVAKSYLSQLENGQRWPSAAVTKKLAVALKVPVSVLKRDNPAEDVA